MEKAISEQILNLLEQYSFDELNSEQCALVLSEITEQKYRAYQLMSSETKSITQKQNLQVPSSVLSNVQEQLTGQFSKPQSGLSKLLTTSSGY